MLHAPPPVPTQGALGRSCRAWGPRAGLRSLRPRGVSRQPIDPSEFAVDSLGEDEGIHASPELLEGDQEITALARTWLDETTWQTIETILAAHEDAVNDIAAGRQSITLPSIPEWPVPAADSQARMPE